jgi:4'-phosphopantetheinyl transferase EntD
MIDNLPPLPSIAGGFRALLPSPVDIDVCSVDHNSFLELLPEEAALARKFCANRRNEFATGRQSLRRLLLAQGQNIEPILVGDRREPILPGGWLASITHCCDIVATTLVREALFAGIGIDIENINRMTPEIESIVIDRYEKYARPHHFESMDWLALHFSSKEAVFKALHGIIGRYIEFADIQLTFSGGSYSLHSQKVGPILQNFDVAGSAAFIGDIVISAAWVTQKSAMDRHLELE